jgi:hypothetical protein
MKTLNIIPVLLVITLFISCGKNDKNTEFVDDKPQTKQPTSDSVNKEPAVDSGSTSKDNPSGDNTSRDKKTENTYKQNFENEKPVAVISPLEAGDYNGKMVTVIGFVADIYQSEKVAYLNFVEKFPNNPFTAVIFSRQFTDFPEIDKYRNKRVEVTGRVSMYKGKPQIILNSPGQLKMK